MTTRRRRFAMRRKAVGLTQESIAYRLGVALTTVARWERGECEPQPWTRPKIAAALQVSMEQLNALFAESAPENWLEVETAKRRAFLAGGLATLSMGLTGHKSAASTNHVTPDLAADMQAVSASYRRAYRTAPAQQLYSSVREHMSLVLSLRPGDHPSTIRTQMVVTAGEMAATSAAILGLDMGQWPAAASYLDFAERAAAETASPELVAVVLATRAFQARHGLGDRQLGLEFAEAAVAAAGQGACRVTRGWVAAVASERHADVGNEATSRRRVDDARSALDMPPDDRPWSGIGSFDLAKITAYEGGNYRRLGDFDNAVGVLDIALSELDSSMRRHRATALIDRAEAHHAAGRVDAACVDTRAALELVAETQHADSVLRAEKLVRSVRTTNMRDAQELWKDVLTLKATTAARLP